MVLLFLINSSINQKLFSLLLIYGLLFLHTTISIQECLIEQIITTAFLDYQIFSLSKSRHRYGNPLIIILKECESHFLEREREKSEKKKQSCRLLGIKGHRCYFVGTWVGKKRPTSSFSDGHNVNATCTKAFFTRQVNCLVGLCIRLLLKAHSFLSPRPSHFQKWF